MSEAKTNYRKYIKNEEPLKYAVLPFGEEEDKIYSFVKNSMRRDMWMVPYERLHKSQVNIKSKTK